MILYSQIVRKKKKNKYFYYFVRLLIFIKICLLNCVIKMTCINNDDKFIILKNVTIFSLTYNIL